jgi:hypothetical protein
MTSLTGGCLMAVSVFSPTCSFMQAEATTKRDAIRGRSVVGGQPSEFNSFLRPLPPSERSAPRRFAEQLQPVAPDAGCYLAGDWVVSEVKVKRQ